MEKMLGISILVSKYKNNDAVINILTKDGVMPVLARGILNPKSKLYSLNNYFIYGEYDLYKGPTNGFKLRDCKVLFNYGKIFKNYEDHVISDFVSEVIFKTTIENSNFEDIYELLLGFFKFYSEKPNSLYALTLHFFAQIEKINGIALNLTSCTQCGNVTDIAGIDFVNGGVVCSKHFGDYSKQISNELLNIYEILFNGQFDDVVALDIGVESFKEITSNLYENFESNLNLRLKSIVLIDSL